MKLFSNLRDGNLSDGFRKELCQKPKEKEFNQA